VELLQIQVFKKENMRRLNLLVLVGLFFGWHFLSLLCVCVNHAVLSTVDAEIHGKNLPSCLPDQRYTDKMCVYSLGINTSLDKMK